MESKQTAPVTTKPFTNTYTLVAAIKPGEIENLRKALRVQDAFQSALDEPGAAEALQHPALKALLAEAAD